MSYTPQQRAFQRGVDIVVATPGRLIDLMDQGVVDLGRVEVTVLDEADHMADLGFMPAVTQHPRHRPGRPASGCCSPPRWTGRSTSSSAAT